MRVAGTNNIPAVTARGSRLTKLTRKPRLGFVGLGWIGGNRLASIARANSAQISVLVDPCEEMLAKAAQHAPGAARLNKVDDLVDAELDGVVIATPSAQHGPQAIAALKHGLAVFCQKPLARNGSEVRAIIGAARSANRLLGVDLSYRHTEALEKIRALVRAGELGEIFGVHLIFHNAYGPQKSWFYDPCQAGGGCVVDLAIHLVDAALWILEQPVVAVTSRLFCKGKRIIDRAAFCEDYATARLDLAGGATMNLTCSWHLHAGRDAIIEAAFYGTKGAAAMRNVNGSFYDFSAERFTRTARETLAEPPDDWFGRAAVHWVEALRADASYDPEIERLIEVHRALDAIYENANA